MDPLRIPYHMLANDPFSQWLGIEILSVELGRCKVGMRIRNDMLNGMQVAHGGISFSLADSALAFASNTYGKIAMSIETSINHLEALREGDYITAESILTKTKTRLGLHLIEVKRDDEIVAIFKGMVYRSEKDWNE